MEFRPNPPVSPFGDYIYVIFFNPWYLDEHVVVMKLNLTNPYNSTTH